MKFRGDKARYKGTLYELRYSYYLNGQAAPPWYIEVKPAGHTRYITTELTHRFDAREAAESFCQDLADGKISFDSLRAEHLAAWTRQRQNKEDLNRKEADSFFSTLDELGISYASADIAISAFFKLTQDARDMLPKFAVNRSNAERCIQENIVNISMMAHELLIQPGVNLDNHDGFMGLTDFIINASKRYEREFGSKLNEQDPQAPSYWESIDDFAKRAIEEQYYDVLEQPHQNIPVETLEDKMNRAEIQQSDGAARQVHETVHAFENREEREA